MRADSGFIKTAITNTKGVFTLSVSPGNYYIEISMIGFKSITTPVFEASPNSSLKDLGNLRLQPTAKELQSISVSAKKMLFEQKIDRVVVNVAASVTAGGNTALDVLERSPGVVVNRQDNSIALSGKSGVVVMINGRINYMTPEAAIQMLAGLSASSIDKIELMSTPPASLDAEGNAGYINIILKKNDSEGLSGSYALSLGYGGSSSGNGETGNGSFNLNYRKKKWYLYGDYSYLRFGQSTQLIDERVIPLNIALFRTYATTQFSPTQNNHNGRLGAEFQVNSKLTLLGLVSAYSNQNIWNLDVASLLQPNLVTDSIVNVDSRQNDRWNHKGITLGFQYHFKDDQILSASTDYLTYNNSSPVTYINTWKNAADVFARNQNVRSSKETPIIIRVAKIDYLRTLFRKVKIEAGMKVVNSQFDNNILLESLQAGSWITDNDLSANYKLSEKITAAYTSFESSVFKRTTLKAGLRYEHTRSNLGTVSQPNIVDRQYGLFFPSLFMSQIISESITVTASYSRRITRPTFNQLAPFVVFSDPYTFYAGNPALQPAISDNFKTDFRYKNTVLTFQYSNEDSTIVRFQSRVQPGTNRQYNISENLKDQQTFSFTIGSSLKVNDWWTCYVNLAALYQQVRAYNNGFLQLIDLRSITGSGTQTFLLPKKWTIEVSGNFNTGRLWGIFQTKAFGAVNLGIQKKFVKNNSKLSLGLDNIFNTLVYRYNAYLPQQNQYFYRIWQWSQPTIKLSFSVSFGNQSIKAVKKETGSEEERKRID